jgi:hypothetical protein
MSGRQDLQSIRVSAHVVSGSAEQRLSTGVPNPMLVELERLMG